MKLKAPIGCHAVSHGRRSIAMAEDGTIDADDEAALIFIAHGFRPIENGEDKQAVRSKADEPSRNTQTMSRSPVAESRDIEALSRKQSDLRAVSESLERRIEERSKALA